MFEYLKNQYTEISKSLFNSEMAINATILIVGTPINSESLEPGFGDTVDGRNNFINKKYPPFLNKNYRIKIYPLEKTGLRIGNDISISYGFSGKYEPYDRWISCLQSDVKTINNKTLFDYTDYIQIQNIKYRIKGVVMEIFSNIPIIHIFLEKDTDG